MYLFSNLYMELRQILYNKIVRVVEGKAL